MLPELPNSSVPTVAATSNVTVKGAGGRAAEGHPAPAALGYAVLPLQLVTPLQLPLVAEVQTKGPVGLLFTTWICSAVPLEFRAKFSF